MIARWRERGKDEVERVGMMAAEREKGMNGQREREKERAVEDKSICSTPLCSPQIIFRHRTSFKR